MAYMLQLQCMKQPSNCIHQNLDGAELLNPRLVGVNERGDLGLVRARHELRARHPLGGDDATLVVLAFEELTTNEKFWANERVRQRAARLLWCQARMIHKPVPKHALWRDQL
eukprot:CAMPEP_0119318624 /NCGR_PEP_ID=MMETSP1333-20130426/46981_1 /TAXON_ID=418940 /ORGANISM="Scyphosphaera apsteinii, Strain RCC1455" /LENGTH=111 /DNA_ID=CAMNT_0007324845 /DNA_START=214 /DNA_END=549 /DNA_ORIENTATION=+